MLFSITDIEHHIDSHCIIDKLSLNVSEGQHLLLLGPSGCGKTTLMNIMAGLLKPTSGDISYHDNRYSLLSDKNKDQLRAENFGFIFQRMHLIKYLTVEKNIALAQRKPAPIRTQELIKDLGLCDKEKQKAHKLSVGEAQRVAIARAVANNPNVIFADEPTSALDDKNAEKVMNLILDQAQKTNATIIAATHDARIKPHFKTVLEMAE
ncbi:MAG: ABC transporter ATP-binding protein [Alphaproteobacteria bacterium]